MTRVSAQSAAQPGAIAWRLLLVCLTTRETGQEVAAVGPTPASPTTVWLLKSAAFHRA